VTSENQTLFDTATHVFAELTAPAALARAESGEWLGAEWRKIEELGFSRALIPEQAGGFGVDTVDALALVRIAGAHALPLPLAETMMAGWFLAQAGLPVPEGPMTLAAGDALTVERSGTAWRIEGRVGRVPWGHHAEALAAIGHGRGRFFVCLLRKGQWQAERGANLAEEPRDALRFDATVGDDTVRELPPSTGLRQVRLLGASMRCLAMAGALDTVLALTVRYAGERVQFGRPIAKFQAIQQNLAILAGEAAAAGGAAGLAAEAVAHGITPLPIAAAKVRVGEAAGIGAAIAHQVHGAIGFTQAHRLHYFTKRLWAWRDEFGGEAEWSQFVGRAAARAGGDGLWPLISSL
jgi:alkylation response protein AidB-like acyl-CoA dehydrogenase